MSPVHKTSGSTATKTPQECRRGTWVKGYLGREGTNKTFSPSKHLANVSQFNFQLKAAINSPHFNRPERKITINVGIKLRNSCSSPAPPLNLPGEKGRVAFGFSGEAVRSTLVLPLSGFYLWNPLTHWLTPETAWKGRLHRGFQICKCMVVRKCRQFFVFFHFPPPSSVWLSSAAQVPWIIQKLLPYVGTGKNVLTGCLREQLWAASLSWQKNVSEAEKRATGCLSWGRSEGTSLIPPIYRWGNWGPRSQSDRAAAGTWGSLPAFLILNALWHLHLVLSKSVLYLK